MILHVIPRVQRAARIQRERLRGNDLGGQRHVGRHDEIACGQPGEDARIGNVETRFDLPGLDERRLWHAERVVRDKHGPHTHAFRGAEQDFLDLLGTSVGVDPYDHGDSLPGSKGSKLFVTTSTENAMFKKPNYKQDKRRREDAQKKRNAEEQERQAARKKGVPADAPQ